MRIEQIDEKTNIRLEELSLERNESKGSVAVWLCENFFAGGVPHREATGAVRTPSNVRRTVGAIVVIVVIVAIGAMMLVAGCYVGRAEFRGEDMRVYPLIGVSQGETANEVRN